MIQKCRMLPGRLLHFTCRDLANMVYGLALLQHRDAVPALCAADGWGFGVGRKGSWEWQFHGCSLFLLNLLVKS